MERTVVSGDTSFGRYADNRAIIGNINRSDALNTRTCLRDRKLGRQGQCADCDVNLGTESMFDTRWKLCLAVVSSKSGMTELTSPSLGISNLMGNIKQDLKTFKAIF